MIVFIHFIHFLHFYAKCLQIPVWQCNKSPDVALGAQLEQSCRDWLREFHKSHRFICVCMRLCAALTQIDRWGRNICLFIIHAYLRLSVWTAWCNMCTVVCFGKVLWTLPVTHQQKVASVSHSQSDGEDDISSTPLRMNSHRTHRGATHRVSSAPSNTITQDDKYSSVPKNQHCGAVCSWLAWMWFA